MSNSYYIGVVDYYGSGERGYPMPWSHAAIVIRIIQPLIDSREWVDIIGESGTSEDLMAHIKHDLPGGLDRLRDAINRNTRYAVHNVTNENGQVLLHVREATR